jgi:uncharacterized protein YbaR (Trm112 family)
MGLFDMLLGVIGGGDARRACPNCDGALDPEGLIDGSYWCDRCGRLYRDEGDGVPIYLPPGYSWPSGRTCERCDAWLDDGVHYLPYEDGSNSHAYIICPSCKHENIQYGFGEDD